MPSTTPNAVTRIRSRYGYGAVPSPPVGSARAAASVTVPRMPHHATTAAARGVSLIASGRAGDPSARGRQSHRLKAAAPVTQAIRAAIAAVHTAAATTAYRAPVVPVVVLAPNNLRPLPSKNIDTGMGLERMAAVMQGVDTNYHINTLRPLVEAAGEICGVKYNPSDDSGRRLRRIADHVRACTIAVHENVLPGPNREKYVIRRLLRRAVLDGYQFGLRDPFLFQLVPVVAQMFQRPYPELRDTIERVQKGIKAEESTFFGTVGAGLNRITKMFDEMSSSGRIVVHGHDAAELYTTYGVPPEMVESMAAELNIAFDWDGYRQAMAEHGEKSGKIADVVFKTGPIEALKKALKTTDFLGYESTEASAEIRGIVAQNHLLDELTEVGHDSPVQIVLDRSPFYAESGGQVGDTGLIVGDGFEFRVTDTQKDGDLIVHHGHLTKGTMKAGAKVMARVDNARRLAIRRAHSATHILHYALQKNLGKDAHQMGSKVEDDWLRFDFGNPAADRVRKARRHRARCSRARRRCRADQLEIRPAGRGPRRRRDDALRRKIPRSGTHGHHGQLQPRAMRRHASRQHRPRLALEIVSEEGVAAGTRRITALTGDKAKEHLDKSKSRSADAAKQLGVGALDVPAAAKRLAQLVRDLKKSISSGGKVARRAARLCPRSATSARAAADQGRSREAARLLNVAAFDVPTRIAGHAGRSGRPQASDLQPRRRRRFVRRCAARKGRNRPWHFGRRCRSARRQLQPHAAAHRPDSQEDHPQRRLPRHDRRRQTRSCLSPASRAIWSRKASAPATGSATSPRSSAAAAAASPTSPRPAASNRKNSLKPSPRPKKSPAQCSGLDRIPLFKSYRTAAVRASLPALRQASTSRRTCSPAATGSNELPSNGRVNRDRSSTSIRQ